MVKYEDTDTNGFFDTLSCDWNGDGTFEEIYSMKSLGLSDKANIIDISYLNGKDYNKIYKKMAADMWNQAKDAMKAAEHLGLETKWYAIYQNPKSLRQKYDFGYWIQLYIFHDIIDLARRTENKVLETQATKAWLSSSWRTLEINKLCLDK